LNFGRKLVIQRSPVVILVKIAVLVSAGWCVTAENLDLDYSPCIRDYDVTRDRYDYFLDCSRDSARAIGDAMERNSANRNVSGVAIDLVDDITDDILNDIFTSLTSSALTLETAYLARMPYTKIPANIQRFSALKYFQMEEGTIKILPSGSLTFSAKLEMLHFFNNQIEVIEEGAFQGDFSDTDIGLSANSLTQFDEKVFRPILESKFKSQSRSEVIVHGNPIPCDCKLAWLLRDNRHLLPSVFGTCVSDQGTVNFYHFDPYELIGC